LPAYALLGDPRQHLLGFVDHETGEFLVRVPLRDPLQVVPELGFGIRAGQDLRRAVMGAAHVAGMARVTAAVKFGRALEHEHRGTRAARADRRAERGIAAADHQYIVTVCQVHEVRPAVRRVMRSERISSLVRL
jgi:hypothetical protein